MRSHTVRGKGKDPKIKDRCLSATTGKPESC
jgi:hypothetical protein